MRYLLLILIIFITKDIYPQGYHRYRPQWEFGLLLGSSNYLGDLGGGKTSAKPWLLDLQIKRTNLSFGGFARYSDNPLYAFRGSLIYGRISGDDRITEFWERRFRNLHFRSDIFELSATSELSLLHLIKEYVLQIFNKGIASHGFKKGGWGRKRKIKLSFDASAFAGLAVFYHNPKAEYQGVWYALQPLGTEGQGVIPDRKPYKRIQFAIPHGLIFSLLINDQYRVGLDIGWRKTFTDYLDDVSTKYVDPTIIQSAYGNVAAALSSRVGEYTNDPALLAAGREGSIRGHSNNKDWYFFTHISVSYKLSRGIYYPKFQPKF